MDEYLTNFNNQDSAALVFNGYGSNHIKSCGHAPDAFAQVAMQLATYRLFGEQVGTYEATQVRKFLHGRTEVTRAVTAESSEFVTKMGFQHGLTTDQLEEKRTLLQNATMSHSKSSKHASDAQGVDRHLFGLQMMVQDNEELPALLTDPVFGRGKKWRVSTSNLSHPKFCNWGYGQVVPDGVGLSYSIHPESLVFNITSLKETGYSDQLKGLLQDVLNVDMPDLLDDQLPKSKL
jgi:carnitine O-acetyltransferase